MQKLLTIILILNIITIGILVGNQNVSDEILETKPYYVLSCEQIAEGKERLLLDIIGNVYYNEYCDGDCSPTGWSYFIIRQVYLDRDLSTCIAIMDHIEGHGSDRVVESFYYDVINMKFITIPDILDPYLYHKFF